MADAGVLREWRGRFPPGEAGVLGACYMTSIAWRPLHDAQKFQGQFCDEQGQHPKHHPADELSALFEGQVRAQVAAQQGARR